VIEPALAAGTWVLSDRFADSTRAYQGWGHGLGVAAIDRLHRLALGGFRPDLTLILDIPVEAGLARAGARRGTETRYERMALDFHTRVRRGFRAIARAEPRRCAVIDARADMQAVAARIRKLVETRLARALAR
jgi:dTMP kinase